MLGAFAALLLTGATAAAGDLDSGQLPQLFIAACLDGQASLAPGSAATTSFDALPNKLRAKLGNPSSTQVWRLNGAANSFLYVLGYQPSDNVNPRICGLASDQMDYDQAADAVELRITGMPRDRTIEGKDVRSIEWADPNGEYKALATKTGAFKVMQINWLSDAQRAALLKGIRHVTP